VGDFKGYIENRTSFCGEGIAYEASQLTITRIITVLGKVALTTRVYTLNIMYFVMVFSVAVGQGTQLL